MMKQVNFRIPLRLLGVALGLLLSVGAFAQITVQGHVKDATGEPVIGATVRIAGEQGGTLSDFDGNFTLQAQHGATLEVSYVGYQTARVSAASSLVVTLQDDEQVLENVVVIGYGRAKKSDLTGAVTAIKPDEMNHGLVTNAQDLMTGKIAGVNVTSTGGAPGAGADIRIRGGASLSASNAPLIVIDGLPMDNNGVQGLSNPLSMVNPNDIESFTVLKDASATAIYGSRASNGVIIITTKKGAKKGKLQIAYNGNMSISTKTDTYDVMDATQYRAFVAGLYGTDSDQYAALGTADTNWQDKIYRTAASTDQNVTLTGNVKGQPFRVTLGGTGQNGILKTSSFNRYTGSVNLSPSLLDDHLKLNANLKGMWAKTRYADQGAIGNAMAYDPTQPVKVDDADYKTSFGGYFQWTGANEYKDDSWPLAPNSLASKNPVSLLDLHNQWAISRALIGNIEADYQFFFLPDLRFHVNGGMDLSDGKEHNNYDPRHPDNNYYGRYSTDKTDKYNLLFTSYLQYGKEIGANNFDVMAGYEWQHFHREGTNLSYGLYPATASDVSLRGTRQNEINNEWASESYLVSFFGRLNYSLLDRYMVTATLRADGSSKFDKDSRWGYFPSVALAWKINEESFLKNVDWVSDLKLRLGYGITGQQEGISEYSYFPSYSTNHEHALYPIIGDGSLQRPNAFNGKLTWEKTTTWNAGLDFGILNGRFTANLDWYYRHTTDLLQYVAVDAGSNFANRVMANTGELNNMGLEFSIGGKVIQAKDFVWDLQYNVTYNHNEIANMGAPLPTGGISGATGHYAQQQATGQAANAFFTYMQVYDVNGQPIENVFVDRDGDGYITSNDRYYYYKPAADVTMGLSSKFIYKNWDISCALRASLGNYVYNNVASNNSNVAPNAVWAESGFFTNFVTAHTAYGFQGLSDRDYESDLWVQNASFLKMDNITLGYSFPRIWDANISGRVYGTVQNVFTWTKYDGLDPEHSGGIDNQIYPRPRMFVFGLNLNF